MMAHRGQLSAVSRKREFGYNEEVDGGYARTFLRIVAPAHPTTAGMKHGPDAGLTLDVRIWASTKQTRRNWSGLAIRPVDGAFGHISHRRFQTLSCRRRSGRLPLYIASTPQPRPKKRTWSGTPTMEQEGFLEVDDVNDGADNGDFVDGVDPVAILAYWSCDGFRVVP